MKDETDILELIRRAKSLEIQGDGDTARQTYRKAAELLTRLYGQYFYKLAWFSLPPSKKHLAEDVAQDVCLEAYRALPTFDEHRGAKLKTWMRGIFYHCRIDAVERDIRQRGPNPKDIVIPVDRFAEKAFLEKRMSQLPDRDRIILILYVEGMTSDEIAEYAGLTSVNIRKIISRSKQFLNGEKNCEVESKANHVKIPFTKLGRQVDRMESG
jgi:RNA polymerase sigma factor (sigma-70 family)